MNFMTLSIKSIFKGETEFQDVNKEIWQTNFDSRYPYTGWAAGNYTPVTELTGDNVSIVPPEATGSKVDKSSRRATYKGNAYYYSLLFEGEKEVKKRYIASVYCYVSPEFNADWLRISSHGDVKGYTASYYDFNQKGKWQKLVSSFYVDSGSFSTYLYFSKLNSVSFDSLKGYMVFAYPEIDEIDFDPRKPITWAGAPFEEISALPGVNANIVPEGSVAFKFSPDAFRIRDSLEYAVSNVYTLYKKAERERNVFTIYAYVSEDFNGNEVSLKALNGYKGLGFSKYNMAKKGKWEKLLISISLDDASVNVNIYVKTIIKRKPDTLRGEVLFAFPDLETIMFDPRNPFTWADEKFKAVKILPGQNSNIVPANSMGCLIDNKSDFGLSRQSMKYVSSSNFGTYPIVKGKRYLSSVYCYVSGDFNGKNVRLGTQGEIYGSRSDFYDLNRKGIWQKLFLNNFGDSSFVSPSLAFEIPANRDVNWLKGYVIIAYPEFNVLEYSPSDPSSFSNSDFKREYPLTGKNSEIVPDGVAGYRLDKTANGRISKNGCLMTSTYNSIEVTQRDSIYASVFCYVSDKFNGNEVQLLFKGSIKGKTISDYDIKNSGKWVKLEVGGKAVKDEQC